MLGTLALAALGLLLLAVLVLGIAVAWYWSDLPPLDKAIDYRPRQHLQVLTADGVEIAQFGTERRIFVPVAQIPPRLKQAVLATEDAGFYTHGGISLRGLARATVANLMSVVDKGMPQGASTITQQVARTFFLSTRRTPERKIKEALLALQLEQRLSKDEILELYLNQIYLGQRAYGFGAAAQVYFGKTLAQLTLAETAMLAGLPQNPIHANPVASVARAQQRQVWVLSRLRKTGAIDDGEQAVALTEPLQLRSPRFIDVNAPHVAEMARVAVVERLGEKAYTEGVRVFTSLRADDQRAAHAALRRAVLAHERKQPWRGPEDHEALPDNPAQLDRAAALALKDQRDDEDLRVAIVLAASRAELSVRLASGETVTLRGDTLRRAQRALLPQAPAALALRRGAIVRVQAVARGKATEWQLAQWPQADAAFVALDPATGRVRALVGGFDFNRQQFNRVTSARRQPGSAFKPFLYSAALEHGVMPETLVDDAPLGDGSGGEVSEGGTSELRPGAWNPKNSDDRYDGEISVREGLMRSKNMVSIRLLQYIGVAPARAWAARFGFDAQQLPQNLTLALGSGSATPLQMAAAYAVFANGGHRVTPVLIERIVDAQGQVLFEAPTPPALDDSTRVVPARNVFLVNGMLADVTARGTAARAQAALQRPDLYGKTGTTNDAVDAWFAGWAPGVVGVGWMGHDDPRSLGEGESGGGLALPIWIDSMARMLRGVPLTALEMPDGVVAVGGDWRYAEFTEGGFVATVGTGTHGSVPASAAASAAGTPALPASAAPVSTTPR
ncbi:MAG: PBP1A family penicillin-binding protein [Rubrivivax sp.]|nr:PBP1A family penicillin-binding protein [Rubrivivax sp.]